VQDRTDANGNRVVIPEGWTAHDGGKMPVDGDTLVRVKKAIGWEYHRFPARAFIWEHSGKSMSDIIAYQEVK